MIQVGTGEKEIVEVVVTQGEFKNTRHTWTTESFNEATGNQCKDFKRNRYQAPDF